MNPSPAPEIHAADVVKTLSQAEATLRDLESLSFRGTELNRSMFACLMALGNTNGLKMGQIAKELLVTKGSITQLVKDMEGKGYVTRTRNPSNEREVIVTLTEQGESAFAMLYPKRQEVLKSGLARVLSAEDQATLLQLLGKIRAMPVR